MQTLPLREAKAGLSAVVEAAERGEPTTITKHGRPAAIVTPLPGASRMDATLNAGLIDHLLSMPHRLDLDRDRWDLREADL